MHTGIIKKIERRKAMHTEKSSWLKHWDFIVADLICLNITFLCAYWLRNGFRNMYALSGYRMLVFVAIILQLFISFSSNNYSGILRRGYLKEFKVVLVQNIELIAFMFGYMFVLQIGEQFSRIMLLAFFFMNTLAIYLAHIILKKIYKNKNTTGEGQIKMLVVSSEKYAGETIEKLLNGTDKSFDIIGISLIDGDGRTKELEGIPVVANGTEVYEYACRSIVDSVLLCEDMNRQEEIEKMTNKFLQMGITVNVKMNMFAGGLPNVSFGHINDINILTTSIKTISSFEMFCKRAVDICAGLAGCIVTGILFIFLAPAIKISDPKGPVFFSQERAGKNGRKFKIYKFRSMYSDAEERKKELMEKNKMDGLMFKVDADPRIIGSGPDGTRKGFGHFLRASSLDEFPNFWSILKGDMSLVGTRPPTMDEYEKYELHHKSRLAMKPGLTGLWQVSGRSDFTDFEEIVKLDNEYIKNWSIALDIKIIVKTIVTVITGKGSQ